MRTVEQGSLRYFNRRAVCCVALGLWACGGGGGSPEGTPNGAAGTSTSNGGTAQAGTGGSSSGSAGTGSPSSGTGGTNSGSGGSTATAGTNSGKAGSNTTGGSGGASGGTSGSGGTPAGTGGAESGSSGTGGTESAGTGAGGTGVAGNPSAGQAGMVGFDRPDGTIPNETQPDSKTDLPKDQWQTGLISPSMDAGHQINQPSVVNGYLLVGGNEEFWFYDVSNPAAPARLSSFSTPGRTGGEAESHSVSFARYGDTFYMTAPSGRGIDTWDITDPRAPQHVGQLRISGVNYGDYTEAVWGVSWQGQYIYVGATNNGIKVVDAANPADLKLAGEISTSQYGGVSAGALDAIGNVLVVSTPKESGGIATLDISDPVKPVRLASLSTDKSYIGAFYRRWVFLITPNRAWDVLTNPRSIGSGSSPLGTLNTENAEYMAFSDDTMFLGHVRAEISGSPGASKISVADPRNMRVEGRVWGRMNLNGINDDQFVMPFGNLLVLGDDQSPYAGWVIAVHQSEPDTVAPVVDTVIPKDQETGVSTKSRVGVTFSDNIELATVNPASFIVRPVGGQPLPGKFGLRMGVVSFDPDAELEPGTAYEIVLPEGGVTDLVGNALATEWKSTFTTN